MSLIIKGFAGGTPLDSYRYSPGVGVTQRRVWQFPKKEDAEAAFASLTGGVVTAELNLHGPPYTLELNSPDSGSGNPDDDYADTWTKPSMDGQKSIFEWKKYRNLPSDIKEAIKQYKSHEDVSSYNTAIAIADAADPSGALGYTLDTLSILELILKGTEHFFDPGCEVKWIRTFGGGYSDASFAIANIGKLYSTATLVAIPKPAIYNACINAAATAVASSLALSSYATSWLKKDIDISQRSNDRFDLTQTWVLDNWSTDLYGAPI